MNDFYTPQTIKVSSQQPGGICLTLDWFAKKAFYPPRSGVDIKPLVNGQTAFGEVYKAIEAATTSVDLITWGFDPAMRFQRPGGLRIGELLAAKGKQGVQVRVLVWRNLLAALKENTTPGAGVGGSGGGSAGSGVTSGTAADNEVFRLDRQRKHNQNIIERQREALQRSETLHREGKLPSFDPVAADRSRERIVELEAENANIERQFDGSDAQGYNHIAGSGGTSQEPWDQIYTRDWFKAVHDGQLKNVEFRTRDFNQQAQLIMNAGQIRQVRGRLDILKHLLNAEGISELGLAQILLLTQFASHHQKMVLVDYGNVQSVGFVMGHNTHRNYWDTDAHLFDDRAAGRDPGFGPWQDISMQVVGPVLTDLSQNFSEAWDLESSWYKRWFATSSLSGERNILPKPAVATTAPHSVAQICRTQPQDDENSILEIYRKAIGNATDYVYMENQYFRYPEFADLLKKTALLRKGRGVPGDLHLFVVTNTPDSATASSTTYEMLKGLGQDQLMPQVQRDLSHSLGEKQQEVDLIKSDLHVDPYIRRNQLSKVSRLEAQIAELKSQGVTPDVESRLGKLDAEEVADLGKSDVDEAPPFRLADLPGLKVVVASLATSDPAPGSAQPERMSAAAEAALAAPPVKARYKHIYVHSKLLLVDDLFTLLSSANINIRSMHSDSELGIAQPNPALAKPLKEKLWNMHAGQLKISTSDNYDIWMKQMDQNWKAQKAGEPLRCHLLRFWDVTTPHSPAFTVD